MERAVQAIPLEESNLDPAVHLDRHTAEAAAPFHHTAVEAVHHRAAAAARRILVADHHTVAVVDRRTLVADHHTVAVADRRKSVDHRRIAVRRKGGV